MSTGPDEPESQISRNPVLLEIPSTFAMLELVDRITAHFGQIAGLDEDSAHGMGVAVREAVVNGIKHGNGCDERKRVRVEYALATNAVQRLVVVRVRDEGDGFEMESLPDPLADENVAATSGRGIFLIRAFMDDVQVYRMPGGGTEIHMAKAIEKPPSEH
jgi:serine/threonine-protein kinase RsbW